MLEGTKDIFSPLSKCWGACPPINSVPECTYHARKLLQNTLSKIWGTRKTPVTTKCIKTNMPYWTKIILGFSEIFNVSKNVVSLFLTILERQGLITAHKTHFLFHKICKFFFLRIFLKCLIENKQWRWKPFELPAYSSMKFKKHCFSNFTKQHFLFVIIGNLCFLNYSCNCFDSTDSCKQFCQRIAIYFWREWWFELQHSNRRSWIR